MDSRPSVDLLAPVGTDRQRRKSSDDTFRGLTDDKNNNFTLYRNCNICSGPLQQDEDDLSIQDMDIEEIHNLNSSSSIIFAPSRRKTSTSTPSILADCIEKFTLRKNAAVLQEATTDLNDYVDIESCKDGPTPYLHTNDFNSLIQQFEAFKLNNKIIVTSQSQVIQNGSRRRRISQEDNKKTLQLPKSFETKTVDSPDKDALPSIQKEERSLKRRKLNSEENSDIGTNIVEKKYKTDINKMKVVSNASSAVAKEKSIPVAPKNKKRSFVEESNQTVVKKITKTQPPVKKLKPNLQELERKIFESR